MTALHITHNPGGNSGSHILCGAERRDTYRMLAEGTAHRYIDRYFVQDVLPDPEICKGCTEANEDMPPATIPPILLMEM